MADGSVVLVEMLGPRLSRGPARRHDDDGGRDPAAARTARPSGPTAPSTCATTAAASAGRGRRAAVPRPVRPRPLHRRAHPAGRPRTRRGRPTSTPSATASAAGPERPRLRRRRRLLVHRPRHPPRRDQRPHRHLLRPARRLVDHARSCSRSTRQRHRPVARRRHALRAETHTGRVCGADGDRRRARSSRDLAAATGASAWPACPGMQLLDSLAVDGDGNVCVATLVNGGITVISPDGRGRSSTCRPTICSPRTSASAGRTCAPPTSPCRARAGWSRCRWPRPGSALAYHGLTRRRVPAVRSRTPR